MLETIAGVCRGLACEVKLCLLQSLAMHEELSVSEAAVSVRLPPAWVSNHLARLVALGMVYRRRSGAHVYCSLAPDCEEEGAFAPTRLVRRAFREPSWATRGWPAKGLVHIGPQCAAVLGERGARVGDAVFDAATGFGNVRRLQVLRLLVETGTCGAGTLAGQVQMSFDALRRHVGKLVRRGYVRAVGGGAWRLAERQRTPFHGSLLSRVAGALERKSRS